MNMKFLEVVTPPPDIYQFYIYLYTSHTVQLINIKLDLNKGLNKTFKYRNLNIQSKKYYRHHIFLVKPGEISQLHAT